MRSVNSSLKRLTLGGGGETVGGRGGTVGGGGETLGGGWIKSCRPKL